LEIALSSDSAQPRDEARFTLKSKPDSTVYLLAVDRSVNLLKSGNNIDKKSVFDDLKAYNAYKNYSKLEIIGANTDDNRYIDVGNSNAFILTNAYDGYVSCHNERAGSETELVANNDDDIDLDETLDDEEFESKTRTEFPETWIFEKVEVNNKGFGSLEKFIPDTMTTWDISGFALSEQFGLGIAEPQQLVVKQKFFLTVHLPYSIRVGEILKVEVTVFNYFTKTSAPLNVDVTLYSESDSNDEEEEEIVPDEEENFNTECEFDFYQAINLTNHCEYSRLESETREKSSTKRIRSVKNSGTGTFFYIKATKAGDRKLKVRAQVVGSKKTFDEVVKTLKVEHEGRTEYRNKPFLVDLRLKERDSIHFEIFVDEDAVKNSIKIETLVMGDLIGPALDSTENLM
jgi:CD109 antigen